MIDKINHYSFTTPASIHDEEAMTALELAGRVGAKMNETVEAVNDFTEKVTHDMENHVTDTSARLDKHETDTEAWLNKQDEDISYLRKTLMPQEVKSEVQRNIQSGEFTSAINEYAGDLKSQVEHLTENIEPGTSTMDAEIVSARQDLKTGHSYANLAQSISNQVERHNLPQRLLFVENLYNSSKAVQGLYVSSDGLTYGNANYATSEKFRVKGGNTIHFGIRDEYAHPYTYEYVDRARGNIVIPFLATYKEDGTLKTYYTDVHDTCVIPADVSFIRFSVPVGDYTDIMCSYFNPYSRFLPSSRKLIRPECLPDVLDGTAVNMINPAEVFEGYYAAMTDGKLYPNDSLVVTGYIPVKHGKDYALFDKNMNKLTMRMYCLYDRDGNFIEGDEYVNNFYIPDYSYDQPYYLRVSIDVANFPDCMFTYADATTFAEYGESVTNAESDVDLSQLESHLGGTYARKASTTLPFPAHLHNFDVVIKGLSSKMTINVGDTTITTERYDDEYNVMVHIHCREGVATVRKMIFSGVTETTVEGVDSGDITCTDAQVISATSPDFKCPLWVIGDSYMGINSDRVYGQLKNLGVSNILRLSRSGLDSSYAYPELVKALEYGTPKVLIWYVGINDTDYTVYQTYLSMVGRLCQGKNITLILNRVPSLPNKDTSEINSIVMHNDYTTRYIDSYEAVNSDNSTWKTGTLSSDNVHPTEQGARLLAVKMLLDAPELMTYGGDT